MHNGTLLKVIIAGGRDFTDYALLYTSCDEILTNLKNLGIEIVSGTCRGADKLGERYANERGFPLSQFPADWEKHGKAAGHIRNEEMAKYSDYLIVFWDGKSRGTENMINLAKKYKLNIRIIFYKN